MRVRVCGIYAAIGMACVFVYVHVSAWIMDMYLTICPDHIS